MSAASDKPTAAPALATSADTSGPGGLPARMWEYWQGPPTAEEAAALAETRRRGASRRFWSRNPNLGDRRG